MAIFTPLKKQLDNNLLPDNTMKRLKKETNLLDNLEIFFQSKSKWILIFSLSISFIISLLLFNRDVSIGGDDSGYIKFAYDFIKENSYPAWHSPFYSIVLSFFILIFGVNVTILKFTSVLFNLGAIFFVNRFFKKYTNHTVTAFVTITSSITYLLCSYASTTYSESFFLFFMAMFLFYFTEIVEKTRENKIEPAKQWKYYLGLGIFAYLLFLTKTVAGILIATSLIVLILGKQYKHGAIFLSASVGFHLVLSFLKKIIWNTQKIGFEDQLEALLLKNPYKESAGKENLMGFFQRFWDNSELYLSKHLMKMTGFFNADYSKSNTVITVIVIAILLFAAIYLLVKSKKLTHAVLSVAALIGSSFFVLQKIWDQDRLVMIYFPFLIGFVAFALYKILNQDKIKKFQFLFILFTGVILSMNIFQTSSQIVKKFEARKNNQGEFGSYTPDWQNYMQASEWAGKNLPSNAVVLCRKPEMSWLASDGKDIFNGIFRLEYNNADSIYNMIKEKKATHVILESFRVNPKMKTKQTITTIKNTLTYLTFKVPGCLSMIKEFGYDEKAYVLGIDLNISRESEQYLKNLETALLVNEKNANVYIEKAIYLKRKNKLNEAFDAYNQGIKEMPDEPYLFFNRGLMLFETHNYAEALADFKKTTDLKSDFNQAWYNQSITLFYMGEYEKAKATLEKAKSLGMKGYEKFEQMLSRY